MIPALFGKIEVKTSRRHVWHSKNAWVLEHSDLGTVGMH
jgi:hypothetical protein